MLVIDASCLIDVVSDGQDAAAVREAMGADPDHAAPHIIDVETFGAIRQKHLSGDLDRTAATVAVQRLVRRPGERFGHRLHARAWELRDSVRGWDAMYVALAEVLDSVLLTTDLRLAAAHGSQCQIIVPERSSR